MAITVAILDARILTKLLPKRIAPISSSTFSNNLCVLLTFVILIFAETTPKTFAAKFPEKVAIPSSLVISLVIKIFKPFVWLVSLFSKSILKILGVSNNDQDKHVSSEELKMVVDDAKKVISNKYQKMLKNIIDLENVRVEDIMIPRNELISVDINKQVDNISHMKNPCNIVRRVFVYQ